MSESVQTTTNADTTHGASPHSATGHEESDVNLKAIVYGGIAIVIAMILAALLCWWLFAMYSAQQQAEAEKVPSLSRTTYQESLAKRIDAIPSPRLEGLEMARVRFTIRNTQDQLLTFSVIPVTRIERANKEVSLNELDEDWVVAVLYREVRGNNQALQVVSPPENVKDQENLEQAIGRIVRIEEADIAARRRLIQAQRSRYGVVKKEDGKEVVRIPVEQAMEAILSPENRGHWLPNQGKETPKGTKKNK